jgi:NAD-dependent SIR2 family protein deacetylase
MRAKGVPMGPCFCDAFSNSEHRDRKPHFHTHMEHFRCASCGDPHYYEVVGPHSPPDTENEPRPTTCRACGATGALFDPEVKDA